MAGRRKVRIETYLTIDSPNDQRLRCARRSHRPHAGQAIVRAVTTLADALGVPVTVEGIENAETHAAVAGFGCAVGQGWYFGKPMSGDQAAALLRARPERAAPPAADLSRTG